MVKIIYLMSNSNLSNNSYWTMLRYYCDILGKCTVSKNINADLMSNLILN